MKYFILFFILFIGFSGFSQEITKRTIENGSELGGDVVLISSSVVIRGENILRVFELESPVDGNYYMDSWVMVPVATEGYQQYSVEINGILSEFTFKPEGAYWQAVSITDVKKNVVTVPLKKGKNIVAFIGDKGDIPHVEFIKFSLHSKDAGILASNYNKYVEALKSNDLASLHNESKINSSYTNAGSLRGTGGQIYDYSIDNDCKRIRSINCK